MKARSSRGAARGASGTRGLLVALLLCGVAIGLPFLLLAWRHNPLPDDLDPARWADLATAGYISPDVLPNLLAIALWAIWAQFVVAIAREIIAQTHRSASATRSRWVFPPIQRLACYLVAGSSFVLSAGPALAAAPPLGVLSASAPHRAGAPASVAPLVTSQAQTPAQISTAPITGQTYVCGPYDTLRSVAAHCYGDSEHWTRIRDASVGLTQADGTRLSAGFIAVSDGTQLRIPTTASTTSITVSAPTTRTSAQSASGGPDTLDPAAGTYTVQGGDTLWSIAEKHYPAVKHAQMPALLQAITHANKGITDGNGHTLRDADNINPGMRLSLPAVQIPRSKSTRSHTPSGPERTAPPQKAPSKSKPGESKSPDVSAVATTAPGATATAKADVSHSRATGTAKAPANQPEPVGDAAKAPQEETADVASSIPAWLLGATLLATGFVALWSYRRRRRDNGVSLDQTLPPANEFFLPTHTALRVISAPESIERLNTVLRWLATLNATTAANAASGPRHTIGAQPAPHLQALIQHTDGRIDVVLRDPGDLPEPWENAVDPRKWRLPAEAQLSLSPQASAMGHPNPALTQIGTTELGAAVYLDLEAIGVLAIRDDTTPSTPSSGVTIQTHTSGHPGVPDAVALGSVRMAPRRTTHESTASRRPAISTPKPGQSAANLRGIARAITATLATSPLAGLPHVHTSGFDPWLDGEERIHAHDSIDDLISHIATEATQIQHRLRDLKIESTLTLRATHGQENADPLVVIATDRARTPQHGARLAVIAGAGHRGVGVVLPIDAAPDAHWVLIHTTDPASEDGPGWWQLEPLGIRLRPVSLAADELASLAALLTEASTPPQEGPTATEPSDSPTSASSATGDDRRETVPQHTIWAAGGVSSAGHPTPAIAPIRDVIPQPGGRRRAEPDTSTPQAKPEPTLFPLPHRPAQVNPSGAEPSGHQGASAPPKEDQESAQTGTQTRLPIPDLAAVVDRHQSAPVAAEPPIEPFAPPAWTVMVCLLGRATLTGIDAAPLAGVRERTVETIAWLALHRNGTRTSLEASLWPTGARAATVSNTISRARTALSDLAGPHAHTWIPHYQTNLHLDPAVTTDLDHLQAHLDYATAHPNHPQTVIPVLRQGLALVRGVPAGWPWLDAELGSILTTTPTAVAALLATLCLDTGDLDGALAATQIGLSVLPAHRGLFAVRMRVRAAAGDLSAVRAEYEAYLRAETADPLTDGETDRDLERLYLTLVRSQSGR